MDIDSEQKDPQLSIPMERKDDKDNTFKYRTVPLVFEDPRFKILLRRLGKDFQTQFMKFFKRAPDAKVRSPAVEISALLAVFTAHQLVGWSKALIEVGKTEEVAVRSTYKVFTDILTGLLKDEQYDSEITEADTKGNTEDDPLHEKTTQNPPDTEGVPTGSDSENRESMRQEADPHGTESNGHSEETLPLPRGDTDTGNSVVDDSDASGD